MRGIVKKATQGLLPAILLMISGCAPSRPVLQQVRNNFYDYHWLSMELEQLQAESKGVVKLEIIGKTYEKRSVYAVNLSGNHSTLTEKPALLAIFTQHGDEHDVTNIAVGMIKNLASNYGKNKQVTTLLDGVDVWIVPMMNPDGVDYDVSGLVEPFTWRKNRKPTGQDSFGVDLNRNWVDISQMAIPEDTAKKLHDKTSNFYAGNIPFSEAETRAVRDFLLNHQNIRIFMDYHSGSGGFFQGLTGCFVEDPEQKKQCAEIIQPYSQKISDRSVDDTPFIVIENDQDVLAALKKHAPIFIKSFLPEKIDPIVGKSLDYVKTRPGIMAIGVEITRDGDFFERIPEKINSQIMTQSRGILFLLNTLLENATVHGKRLQPTQNRAAGFPG